jgi:hypothetical protein
LIKNPDGEDSFNHWCLLGQNRSTIEQNRLDAAESLIKFYNANKECSRKATNWSTEWSDCLKGWSLEKSPTGATEKLLDKNNNELCCFVTSFFLSEKMQVVDLVKEGLSENLQSAAVVEVSERYTQRLELACDYNVIVLLISSDYEIIDQITYSEFVDEFPCPWKTFNHRFALVPSSKKKARYVLFNHSGKV